MSSLALLGLEWSRPLALAALAVPLVVWWLARRARGAPTEATGTLELWREVARERPPAAAGRRTSLALWLALAALVCAVLALAGPRAARARENVIWRVIVDRSPSMYLAHDGARGPTRLEVAFARARALIDRAREPGDLIAWLASDGVTPFAEELSSAPQLTQRELDWAELDEPGLLVVTDHAPPSTPLHAGFVASGGAAAPGPVAYGDGKLLVWDGREVRPSPEPVALHMHIDSEFDDSSIARVARAWSASRGVALVEPGECELELVASWGALGMTFTFTAGRDGWRASEPGALMRSEPGSELWLSGVTDTGAPVDLVRWRPGRIVSAWLSGEKIEGDPAAFAVSWAQLFDAALLPPRGVVALEERRAAGDASERAPERPTGSRGAQAGLDALLAMLAAVLAFAALQLRR